MLVLLLVGCSDAEGFDMRSRGGTAARRGSGEKQRLYIPPGTGKKTFVLDGRAGFIWKPVTPAGGRPWIMYAPVLSPSAPDETFYITATTGAPGITWAGINVGESYGAPYGRAIFQRLYEEMVYNGYSQKPLLLARSRGGLMLYNWAIEHPTRVAAIAGIYPVGDMSQYPGLASVDLQTAYGMDFATISAQYPNHNPVGRLAGLASAGVQIYHVHGDADTTVTLAANSQTVKTQYDGLSGTMTLEVIAGGVHDLNAAYFNNNAFRDFMIANVE